MQTRNTYILKFDSDTGATVSLRVPRADITLDDADIGTIMTGLVANGAIFDKSKGALASVQSAQLETINTRTVV